MNKFAMTLCIAGTAMALSACDTMGRGDVDTAPPYATERTASHSNASATTRTETPVRSERVFKEYQTK